MEFVLIGLFFILGGVFCFLGSYKQWGFFVRNRKYRRFARFFGETRARAFYIGNGIFLIVIGACLAFFGLTM